MVGWTASDAAVLAEADHMAARTAASARLAAALALSFALAVAAWVERLWNWWAAGSVVAFGFVALVMFCHTRRTVPAVWVPWTLCLIDAAFLASVVRFGPWFDALAPGARAAMVSPWAAFLLIALAAIHLQARLILFQTALLSLCLALTFWSSASATPYSPPQMAGLFADGSNVARLALLGLAGGALALAAHSARQALRRSIRASRERDALGRFVPPELGGRLAAADADELRKGDRRIVAVLFVDLRNFSGISDSLSPEQVAALLVSFRRRVEAIARRHCGVIDKFIGDGVLIVFGVPSNRPDDAANALAAAIGIAAEIERWSAKRLREGRAALGVGVGLHLGEAFVGAIGNDRLEFTVIGDVVNLAQRLEESTRLLDTDVVVSAAAFEAAKLQADDASRWILVPDLRLRGRDAGVRAFALRRQTG